MRTIYRNLIFTLFALAISTWAIIPPEKKLRLGKDLRGGVSLVYSVQTRDTAGQDPKTLIDETISVLKDRVDPDGLFEISMVAQGTDRIEITMPLPSDRVKALSKAYRDELEALGAASLNRPRLERTLRLPPSERAPALERLSNKNSKRLELLNAAAAAFDAAAATRDAFIAETDPARKDTLAAEAAGAELALDDALAKALATALSSDDLHRVLTLSTKPRSFSDREGKTQTLPSPREEAERKLREAHPDAAADIDRVIATFNAYAAERKSLDDPEDLKRLLRSAGVLSFRISVKPGAHPDETNLRQRFRELGPRNANADDARWYRINRIDGMIHSREDALRLASDDSFAADYFRGMGYVVEARGGDYYMLAWDTPGNRLTKGDHADQPWAVAAAYQSRDELGKPCIAFAMDAVGTKYLGQLTAVNVGNQMAVLLDDEVYTAPTLRSAISSNGQITGDFSQEEINYVVRVLSGGTLQQALSPDPISQNSIAPALGFDNLRMGLMSGVYSVILVAVFMVVYYFRFGLVAVLATMVNALLIMGAMSLSKAAFTMPGIAGMILTFGMAVDSNVLIYERIREELNRGADLKTAVRLGFERALSSIVDGNITNLIVCVVLYYTGTPEVRGFAITMGIGVVSTLFAALVFSRMVFDIAVNFGWRKASMLPMAWPGLQKFLTPNINWLRLRYIFYTISAVYVGLGFAMIWYQGSKMLDTEFLGGTKLTIQLREGPDGKPLTLTRDQVQQRAQAAASDTDPALRPLLNAEVIPINPREDGVTSDRFEIKVGAAEAGTDPDAIPDAIVAVFADTLEIKPPLAFTGSELTDTLAPVYPIEKATLGENVDTHASRRDDVQSFLGGAAIIIDNIDPPTPLKSIAERMRTARQSAEFSGTIAREVGFIILEGDENAVESLAVLVRDDNASYLRDEAAWSQNVRAKEWALTVKALTGKTSLAGVNAFSPAIASSFRADAITASVLSFFLIGIYIWVRFKTLNYALAAVVALVHDVLTVIGLLAFCEILYETPATAGFARSIGLLPFKIDLNTVAALLTIAGYSLNDTVVIMDRIRENRGKLLYATSSIINTSINQTFSRTIITGGTTLGSCLILYFIGGEGMRSFAFSLATGLIVGTYSSVAIAAPIVWSRKHEDQPELSIQPVTL